MSAIGVSRCACLQREHTLAVRAHTVRTAWPSVRHCRQANAAHPTLRPAAACGSIGCAGGKAANIERLQGCETRSVAESCTVSCRRRAARRSCVSAQAASSDNAASSPDYVQEGGFRIEQVCADYQRRHCYSSSATFSYCSSLMSASHCWTVRLPVPDMVHVLVDMVHVLVDTKAWACQCRRSPVVTRGLSASCGYHLAPHRRPCCRRCPSAPS